MTYEGGEGGGESTVVKDGTRTLEKASGCG